MSKKDDEKCKYCYYNTVLSCSEDPKECEDYDFNHLAKKYENKRFKAKWEDGNDVHVLVTDELEKFPDWYFETLEDAEELADFMNDLWQQSQDIEDVYVNAILNLLDKNLKLKSEQKGLVLGDVFSDKINVLLELLDETGNEHLVVEFSEKINEEVQDELVE